MTVIYDLEHVTTYRYRQPVIFGEHRAIFLPSLGYGGRILTSALTANVAHQVRWVKDTLSNNVALLTFEGAAEELAVTYRFRGEHFGVKGIEGFPLSDRAIEIPVQYTPDEWTDLAVFMRPHAEDPDGRLATWAKTFIAGDQDETLDVLERMMKAIWTSLTYQAREAEGVQPPGETLRSQSGTCRDYAWLMIEALRRLGFACRFVSGYLYDAALDGGEVGMTGSGATHAWLQVYLPGAGWRSYDPTNQITEGFDLIPVAIARHPGQVMPLSGAWSGRPNDYLGMTVEINIHKVATLSEFENNAG
jgi:transglutaminase-like putative cysteine protease